MRTTLRGHWFGMETAALAGRAAGRALGVVLAGGLLGGLAGQAPAAAPPGLNEVLRAYANLGQAFALPLAYAPFPHPARAQGYRYKEDFYPEQGHYHDPRVVVFMPKGFRESGPVDLVVWFHGWRTSLKEAVPKFQLIEQFAAAGKNALLVVPQGPRDAPDSFGGKLEDPDGFRRFVEDLLETLQEQKKLTATAPGQILLAGHSGGYQVMAAILDRGGLTDQVREVYLFDGLYGQREKFAAWLGRGTGKFIVFSTPYAGTRAITDEFQTVLTDKGLPAVTLEDDQVKPETLATNRLVFVRSGLTHDEVVFKKHAFRDCLRASRLKDLPPAR